MKTDLLFIHSAGPQGPHEGSGEILSWLTRDLDKGFRIRAPLLPDPPSFEGWEEIILRELASCGERVCAVGHSLGGSVLLKVLATHPTHVTSLVTIAAPLWGMPEWEYDEYVLPDDLSGLDRISSIELFHSRDDDVVSFEHLAAHARRLPRARTHALDGYGHYFARRAPEVLKAIAGT